MRVEKKYLTSTARAEFCKERVALVGAKDPFCIQGPYQVTSLYFDTPDFGFYDDKCNGEHSHLKIRARRYNDSSLWFLEAKLRVNFTEHKLRFKVERSADLLSTLTDELRVAWAGKKFGKSLSLIPTVEVRFLRMAYEYSPHLRLTFDSEIVAKDSQRQKPVVPGHTVVEVKSQSLVRPQWLEGFLAGLGAQVSFSKYFAACEVLSASKGG